MKYSSNVIVSGGGPNSGRKTKDLNDNIIINQPTRSLMWRPWSKTSKKETIQQHALDFMQGVMDECTHLGNFSIPVDSELIIIVLAKKDAYIPTDSILSLTDLWPGAEVRYVDRGHITTFLFNQNIFR